MELSDYHVTPFQDFRVPKTCFIGFQYDVHVGHHVDISVSAAWHMVRTGSSGATPLETAHAAACSCSTASGPVSSCVQGSSVGGMCSEKAGNLA